MKTVSIEPIAKWIHRNARELELALWKYHFEEGDQESVVRALMFYQNEDGGFGHAVEPDIWNTDSTPYVTLYAMRFLEGINFFDMSHPIYQGIRRYIEATFMEDWHFVVPSNNECPCASFHRYDAAYDEVERTGIIIGYCSFILRHYAGTKMYEQVLEKLPTWIERLEQEKLGDMGPGAYVDLVETMGKIALPGYDHVLLQEKIKKLVDRTIQRNPNEWANYGYRPSDFIRSKESRFYKGNETCIEQELDFLCDTLPAHDVWENPWSWFDNNDKYPAAYHLSTNWYKAIKAIDRALLLWQFDRLQTTAPVRK